MARPAAGAWIFAASMVAAAGQRSGTLPEAAPQGELRRGRELLSERDFAQARHVFGAYLKAHPDAIEARLGLGDAQLGSHEYEAAESTYRAVATQQPELWQAHKNLVVVEAALGRWEEFDRERTVLRMARERGAPGISARESDVIDSFRVRGQPWVVRAYFEPVGRSEARYNFEQFSPEGRVEAYLSLEDAAAARAALTPGDVRIGTGSAGSAANSGSGGILCLNWYTSSAHGAVRAYSDGEPSYERLRADALQWISGHPELAGQGRRLRQPSPDAPAPRTER